MNVVRLTNVAGVLRNWEFLYSGLQNVQKFLRYDVTIDTYRRIICHLVKQPNAYVAIVFDKYGEGLGFAIAHESTPLFSTNAEYEVSILYHRTDQADATALLQEDFHKFCASKDVYRYFLTTRRDSGSAIRCFQGPRFGLQRAYTVFKKELK